MSENVKNSDEVVDDKKADGSEKNDKTNASVDNNSVNNKSSDKAGNTKGTTNSSKSNDDNEKNAKKSNDDSVEPGNSTSLGEIPKVEKYIANTRIDGLQTLYQICFQSVGKTNVLKKNLRQFDGFDFENGSPEFKKRVEATQKLELPKLKAVCEGLQLDKKGPKEIICQRIVEFLVAPHIIDVPSDEEDDEDDDEDDDAEEAGEEEEEEEEEEEPEKKSRSKGRGNARNAVSKTGRPRRSTAGRGKDTSAYVEYSSSSDDGEKPQNRSKPAKRRRDDSDSGSDYNPSASGDSDAGNKRKSSFVGRGRPGSRRSTRRRQSSSEEEESSPTSDEDFSDEPKSRKRPAPTRGRSARNRGRKPKESEESELSEEDDEELSEPESDHSEESPKRKAPTKNSANNKSTPQRSKRAAASTKPLKEESSGENESEDDEPLSKKAKPLPPTDDEIKKIVKEILDKANLEEITMKTVCRHVYSKYPDFDLSHKKEFIKTTVKSLIST